MTRRPKSPLSLAWTFLAPLALFAALPAIAGPEARPRRTMPLTRTTHSSPAVPADGAVVFGGKDETIRCVAPDGTERWAIPLREAVCSTPAVAADGTIYVSADDVRLRAISPDGRILWTAETGGWLHSSPVIAADETL